LTYFTGNKAKITKESSKNSNIIISGECQGSKSDAYSQTITIRKAEDENAQWVGTCDCDNCQNKGNNCSHLVAVLLEWVDDKALNTFNTRDISEKVRIKKAPKTWPISKDDVAAIKKEKKKLEDQSVQELKQICRYNLMVQTGNKDEIIDRIAQSTVLGVIPKCPLCGGGRPKYGSGFWFCEGYRDDTDWRDCHWIGLDIKRTPWKVEEK